MYSQHSNFLLYDDLTLNKEDIFQLVCTLFQDLFKVHFVLEKNNYLYYYLTSTKTGRTRRLLCSGGAVHTYRSGLETCKCLFYAFITVSIEASSQRWVQWVTEWVQVLVCRVPETRGWARLVTWGRMGTGQSGSYFSMLSFLCMINVMLSL